ncbi:MAG: Sensor histidine kinase YycG [Alphaproteobacteria bacterium MarineAlpha2_Bin1]|nr:MAG: Sensor histidine kinase YycG [Alphaproteobacteria bacterium MarineAlpha2_Bin1]
MSKIENKFLVGQDRKRKKWKTITVRILTINIFGLLILMGGMLYLNQFREGLINSKIISLTNEGSVVAGALSQSALDLDKNYDYFLNRSKTNSLLRRMVNTTSKRARVFNSEGDLISDSRIILEAGRNVQAEDLPNDFFEGLLYKIYSQIKSIIPWSNSYYNKLPKYSENIPQLASDYNEVSLALLGETHYALRSSKKNLIISVAVPIQSFKTVQGALLLSTNTTDIDERVSQFQMNIIKVSGLSLLITILLSLYLSNVLTSPVKQLARAANRVRNINYRQIEIPDFTSREDEIGDLSYAIRDMTQALYNRIDAIESFAADVSHEIKNPLTSLGSAIDAFNKVSDKSKQEKLVSIMKLDLKRIDRLITDISNASRLDAELSRSNMRPINIINLLETILIVYKTKGWQNKIILESEFKELWITGIEDSIGQIIKNLVDNAISFSPKSKPIKLKAWQIKNSIFISCEDEGPGFRFNDMDKIFDRFYTKRSSEESFGKHSGLGLYISKKIAKVHGGQISAKNKKDAVGNIIGAIFILEIPVQ